MNIIQIPLHLLRRSTLNHRSTINQDVIRSMVDTLSSGGVLPPIMIRALRDQAGYYGIVQGQHRCEAYRRLNRTTIPAVIFEGSEKDAVISSFRENNDRTSASYIEDYEAALYLFQRGMSKEEVKLRMYGSESKVDISKHIRVAYFLSEEIKNMIRDNSKQVTSSVTSDLIRVPEERQMEVYRELNENGKLKVKSVKGWLKVHEGELRKAHMALIPRNLKFEEDQPSESKDEENQSKMEEVSSTSSSTSPLPPDPSPPSSRPTAYLPRPAIAYPPGPLPPSFSSPAPPPPGPLSPPSSSPAPFDSSLQLTIRGVTFHPTPEQLERIFVFLSGKH